MVYDPNNPNDPLNGVDPTVHRPVHAEPPKKSGPMGPWLAIIVLLVIAGFIWMSVGRSPSVVPTGDAPASSSSSQSVMPKPDPVAPATAPAPDTPVTTDTAPPASGTTQ